MRRILATTGEWPPTLLRLAAGAVIFPHGAQKLLGLFGGYGPEGTLAFMGSLGIPPALAWLAIIAEFFGGIGLVFGALTRVASLGVLVTLGVAMVTVHLKNGWFLNWSGKQAGEGIEFFLLALPVLAVTLVKGGGAWSVDGVLARLSSKKEASADFSSAVTS